MVQIYTNIINSVLEYSVYSSLPTRNNEKTSKGFYCKISSKHPILVSCLKLSLCWTVTFWVMDYIHLTILTCHVKRILNSVQHFNHLANGSCTKIFSEYFYVFSYSKKVQSWKLPSTEWKTNLLCIVLKLLYCIHFSSFLIHSLFLLFFTGNNSF